MNVGQAQNTNNVILIGIIYCKEMGDSISFMPSPWGLQLIFFLYVCVCDGRTHRGWWEKLRLQSLMKSWARRCNMWKKKHKTFIRRRNQNMWQFIELSGFVWGPREQDLWILFYAKRETLAECSVLSKPEGKFGAVLMSLMSVCTLLSVWVWGVYMLVLLPCTESLLCLISAQQQQPRGPDWCCPGSLISPTRHHLQCSALFITTEIFSITLTD